MFNAWDSFVEISNGESSPIPLILNPQQQFDEYEALLVTCLHYSVRIGITEQLSLTKSFHFLNNFSQPCLKNEEYGKLSVNNKDVFSCISEESLRGQATVVGEDRSLVLSLGGSDQTSKIIPRLTQFQCSIANSQFSIEIKRIETNDMLQRMYSSATLIPSTNCIMYMGGRKSPFTPSSHELIRVIPKNPFDKIRSGTDSNEFSVVSKTEIHPCARWRHGMLYYVSGIGNDAILLFGGKTVEITNHTVSVLDKVYISYKL